ncbi:RNA 2',3'-cyclic phosphodiesterase [Streptomyces sp. NPDC059637]|uniref:RNA 2',3'-cyclic phosphodiesterase n=1 Tax=Streptomyces sp. NPDC059637 TaxID=3347752 RepID=UPI00368B0172
MRLFVAVTPPAPVLDELARRVGHLRELPGADGLRWFPRENWHLTTTFLGEVADPEREELEAALAAAAGRYGPFGIALAGGGRFGDRTLWTDVEGDREVLVELAGAMDDAARACGVRIDDRPYRPHLTLARGPRPHGRRRGHGEGSGDGGDGSGGGGGRAGHGRHGRSRARGGYRGPGPGYGDPWAEERERVRGPSLAPFADALADYRSRPWTVDAVELVSSTLRAGPGGSSRYETVRTWPLAAAGG